MEGKGRKKMDETSRCKNRKRCAKLQNKWEKCDFILQYK
jgi:hypothetical protein